MKTKMKRKRSKNLKPVNVCIHSKAKVKQNTFLSTIYKYKSKQGKYSNLIANFKSYLKYGKPTKFQLSPKKVVKGIANFRIANFFSIII